MKNKTLILIFTILCNLFFISGAIKAQNIEEKSAPVEQAFVPEELILGIPKLTDKTLYLLTGSIQQINGLTYDTYCNKHKIVLISYNPNLFTRAEDVIEAIQNNDFNLPMIIKEGTFREVKQICTEN